MTGEDPQVYMIHSYKGGSGKTLFSANFAAAQVRRGKKVLLIEGDLQGPVYYKIFDELRPDRFLNSYLKSDDLALRDHIYSTPHDFDIVFASPRFTLEDLIAPGDYEALLHKIRSVKQDIQELDYNVVIIDLAPGVNYFAVASIVLSDHIVVILRPDQNAFEGVKTLLDVVYLNTVRKENRQFHLIWSQVPDHPGFEEMISKWEAYFTMQYNFISSIHKLPFEAETSYNFVRHQLILPANDPTLLRIERLADEF